MISGRDEATIELAPEVPVESLDGIEEFSHAEILFVLDRVSPAEIIRGVRHPRGNAAWPAVGTAQAPRRGPIAWRDHRLHHRRDGARLEVAELDAVEGTPVVDIKPVFAEFLPRDPVRQPGWTRDMMRDYWTRDPGRG
jgi:tRNA (Thr-GGU) A37 N-methylase